MAEEKGILLNSFEVEVDGIVHMMNVDQIVQLIENAPHHEQKHIKDTFSKIDFANGDLMHYIKFLATAFIKMNY
jgi:uncharacterized protein (DUF169 family)